MVIEGPWIKGIDNRLPRHQLRGVRAAGGSGGRVDLHVHELLGHPAADPTRVTPAVSLVEFLTSDEQQLAFADAFGVIPSTESAAATYADTYPENAAFVAGADYAVRPVNFAGSGDRASPTSTRSSQGLANGGDDEGDPRQSLQTELQAALDEANAQLRSTSAVEGRGTASIPGGDAHGEEASAAAEARYGWPFVAPAHPHHRRLPRRCRSCWRSM